MARTIDTVTIQLITNGSQTKQELTRVITLLSEAQKKKEEAFKVGDAAGIKKYTKEVAKLEAEEQKLLARSQNIKNAMERLDKATPKQLRQTIQEINNELNSGAVKRGTEEWKHLTDALKKTKAELKDIQTEQKAAVESGLEDSLSLQGLKDWGNKWLGTYTIAKDAYNAVASSMQEYIDKYAELSEHLVGVAKYTGLTTKDVEELNEAFRQMDTRTSIEALNDLAAEAGMLGLTAKEDVLGFVEQARAYLCRNGNVGRVIPHSTSLSKFPISPQKNRPPLCPFPSPPYLCPKTT